MEDSIENPYVYLNELKVNIPETKNSGKLMVNIQGLSENKELRSANPKKRLALKKELLKNCLQQKEAICLYIPEKYEMLYNARRILSLKYCYNSFGNRDEYYKYACFDLKTGERITYEEMFLNPEEILQTYNEKYVREITDYLRALKTEEDEEAK
ncbi:hypothetical protein [Sinomicrobium pectinilyticum]|uniref:hypothetical protein n=1 Tax=Sinomicrobium pectinilyticum TaxID=1084421 RepID=UPI0011CE5C35|nr:hypothetical protein [Sinomicrobium pectinilyticum]